MKNTNTLTAAKPTRKWKWNPKGIAGSLFAFAFLVAFIAGGVVTVLQRVSVETLLAVFTSITWWSVAAMLGAFAVLAVVIWWEERDYPEVGAAALPHQ